MGKVLRITCIYMSHFQLKLTSKFLFPTDMSQFAFTTLTLVLIYIYVYEWGVLRLPKMEAKNPYFGQGYMYLKAVGIFEQ